jgi:murein DD-endopeptidase MepM/ murein hydrolase activator NlpD
MSRADRFDRGDFEARYVERVRVPAERPAPVPPARSARLVWPIARAHLQRVGQSVLQDRDGRGRPHKGVDLFAPAGTEVRSACTGRVLRVVDGRISPISAQRRAGLFVDVQGDEGRVYRYLHLHEVRVAVGVAVDQGAILGTVAPPFTSGLAEATHLHFEIRQGDVDRDRKDYGPPVDPLRILPSLRA